MLIYFGFVSLKSMKSFLYYQNYERFFFIVIIFIFLNILELKSRFIEGLIIMHLITGDNFIAVNHS